MSASKNRMCTTPGCKLKNLHAGLCTLEESHILGTRKRHCQELVRAKKKRSFNKEEKNHRDSCLRFNINKDGSHRSNAVIVSTGKCGRYHFECLHRASGLVFNVPFKLGNINMSMHIKEVYDQFASVMQMTNEVDVGEDDMQNAANVLFKLLPLEHMAHTHSSSIVDFEECDVKQRHVGIKGLDPRC